jgi:Txe/YoeB family toxin of Txe-Axe toxin-antitoxin module
MSYNSNRYYKYKHGWINTTTTKYSLAIDKEVKLEIKSLKDLEYKRRVNKLISYAVNNPKSDYMTNLDMYNITKYYRPEATHRRSEYDEESYQVWSKDIDEENRLMYKIYDHLKKVFIISIEGHDLDKSKQDTKLQSDLYDQMGETRTFSLDQELDRPESRKMLNYLLNYTF